MNPIDIVITWVDGDDPAHRARREACLTGAHENLRDDIGGETRFRSLGEIDFCVCSIMRFAPFVRKIFIVTDRQEPHLDKVLRMNFPDNRIPVEIIDHSVIFRGFEQYLPTFNSLSIETMLWRIPGLSEDYVYMNDDFLLTAPVSPADWFVDGKPVVYAYWHNTLTARICRVGARLRHRHPKFLFRDSMLNAADMLGGKALLRFLRILHTPLALKRSWFAEYFKKNPEALVSNIRHRFRHRTQFNPQALQHTALALCGEAEVRSNKGKVLYIEPFSDREVRFDQYMKRLLEEREAPFCCINSLDRGSEFQRQTIINWVEDRLDIKLPSDLSTHPHGHE